MSTNEPTVTIAHPGAVVGDTYRFWVTPADPRFPGEGNRHARRKAAAERRHAGGFTAARPYELHAVAIPNDGTPVALKVGV